jgi:ABC-type uncharacterized transport system YnjBCD ATPase subunit
LTNIGSGHIEGLPVELRTVYVQHDDHSEDNGVPLVEEIAQGKDMIEAGVGREEIEKALRDIFFTEEMLVAPRSALSGGWKMKVLIIRAMLARADVLLLDEVSQCRNSSMLIFAMNNTVETLCCFYVLLHVILILLLCAPTLSLCILPFHNV